jgi:hypothetical protein
VWLIFLFTWIGGVVYMTGRVDRQYQDSTYYYKVLNAPVRSMEDYKVTEDTAFIHRLEDSTKEILK